MPIRKLRRKRTSMAKRRATTAKRDTKRAMSVRKYQQAKRRYGSQITAGDSRITKGSATYKSELKGMIGDRPARYKRNKRMANRKNIRFSESRVKYERFRSSKPRRRSVSARTTPKKERFKRTAWKRS